jgi:hypothetical protein
MTKREQQQFVRNLCRSVATSINARPIPSHWDGNELRVLLAREFAAEARPRFTTTRADALAERRRMRRINNEIDILPGRS